MVFMRILFICNQNENRSKTAEEIFKDRFETKSAGVYNERPVTKRQMKWADVIVFMEDSQRKEITQKFPEICIQKKVLTLNIPDVYHYNQPELIGILNSKVNKLF